MLACKFPVRQWLTTFYKSINVAFSVRKAPRRVAFSGHAPSTERSVNMRYNRYICTGPPGGGKTSVLNELRADFVVVSEPARRVLSIERETGGTGTGDQNPARFVSLMLNMSLSDLENVSSAESSVLFDRSVPDLLAFAAFYNLPTEPILRAMSAVQFHPNVFWFPAWEEIYETDEERTMSFYEARAFGDLIREAYLEAGYNLIEMPLTGIRERADFIQDAIG